MVALVIGVASVMGVAGCGDGNGARTAPTSSTSTAGSGMAREVAERFLTVFFREHQTGRLSRGGRRALRASSTPTVFQTLMRQSRSIESSEDRCEAPRIQMIVGSAESVVADAVVSCESNPEIGYGVRLEQREGHWVVTSLEDARCDADVVQQSRAQC
jgi:hypothetical protein